MPWWCYSDNSRFDESERDYKKYLELKPKSSSAEKELSQLGQAKSALESAYSHFDLADFAKVLEYIDKIVLVFSPGCTKVCAFATLCCFNLVISKPIL